MVIVDERKGDYVVRDDGTFFFFFSYAFRNCHPHPLNVNIDRQTHTHTHTHTTQHNARGHENRCRLLTLCHH
jgi:hypothetical protein